jgi:DNA-binding LacI/PurR family transcriptional regulator
MGNRAARMLIDHIESREAVTPQRHYLDATLVIRKSTAPLPASRIPLQPEVTLEEQL